jgi:hypothetical protein
MFASRVAIISSVPLIVEKDVMKSSYGCFFLVVFSF